MLSIDHELLYSESEFEESPHIKVNYSSQEIGGLQIIPSGLLSETGVKEHEIAVSEWRELTVFYANRKGQIPFDLFSAVFYLISRYEEYIPSERDSHDRFLAQNSILFKHDLILSPLVDLWCRELRFELLGSRELNRTFRFISTIDVDNAYAYKFKSFGVKVGGTIKSILRGDWPDVSRRFGCYFRQKVDPYDTYDVIANTHHSAGVKPIYFFLLSDRNEWDRNLGYTNKHYRGLISALQRENDIGIHPGYNTYQNAEKTYIEKIRLEDITGKEVLRSRQHFLKFVFPETARNLVECGIKEDYSLGYAEVLGFRAGTCTPFKFFDLLENESRDLVFHSTALMDATLNRYLGLSPKEAEEATKALVDEIKAVNGELVVIWHNETLSEQNEWKGWSSVFKDMVSYASKDNVS